jgi:hypothetical protein
MKPVLWRAIALVLLCSSTSAADPIRVTSGTIELTDEPGTFHIAGSGFEVKLDEWFPIVLGGTLWFDHCSSDFRCLPGATVDFTATYGFAEIPSIGGIVNGVSHPALFPVGTLAFQGPLITIPSSLEVDQSVALGGSFAFQGDISVFTDETRTGPPLFTGELTGRGTAEALGRSNGRGVSFHDLVYSFESPVPDPSTLVLLISGTVVGAIRRRRRHCD